MSTLCLAAVLLAAPPTQAAEYPSAAQPPTVEAPTVEAPTVEAQQPVIPLRTGVELRDAVRDALQKWARVDDNEAQRAAWDFLRLFDELRQDTDLASSQRDEFTTKVRGRLMKLSVQIKKRAAIDRRLAKQKQPDSVVRPADRPDVLAQRGGMMGGGMMGGGMRGGMMGGGMMGGGGQQPVNDDAGEDLVELIQTVISPASWDINGGLGSAYYWRPGRAMVIRQNGQVHDQIGDVLRQLGNAGR